MTRAPAGNEKINLYFNSQVLQAMKRLALLRGTTYSELVREACREYVLTKGADILKDTAAIKGVSK